MMYNLLVFFFKDLMMLFRLMTYLFYLCKHDLLNSDVLISLI